MKTDVRGWVCAVSVMILSLAAAFLSGCTGLVSGANTTPPPPSTLVITNVQTGSVTTSSSQVVWTTNVPANSSIYPPTPRLITEPPRSTEIVRRLIRGWLRAIK